jgi:hypothetical protein
MKTISIISILFAVIIITACKKKQKMEETVIITGTIFRNCNDVASNATYYFVFPVNQYNNKAPIAFTTDANGMFSYEVDKYSDAGYGISASTNFNDFFGGFKCNGENKNIGIIRESASNQLVLKVKTNHILTNMDTINYVFRYDLVRYKVHGPITKDTIIGIYNKSIAPNLYNDNPSTGELKTIWWGFGQPTPTNQVQVDYTIHGCAGVADTAYIVVP